MCLHDVRFGSIANSCTAAKQYLYSITSSAVASSVGDISTLSAFAVLRLMTSSNFVARITGRSAGFSPFKIRPT